MKTKKFTYEVISQLSYGGKLDERVSTKEAKKIIERFLKNYTKYIRENVVGILATTGNPELDPQIALNEIDEIALEIFEYLN